MAPFLPMILTRTVQPTSEPLSLDLALEHLRVDSSHEYGYVANLISVAREHIESELRRTLAPCTWELITEATSVIALPMPPIVTVESVTDEDGNDVAYTLQLDKSIKLSHVPAGLIKVVYTAGRNEVPAVYLAAMKLIIGHLFENREEVVIGSGLTASQLPVGVSNLLAPTRNVRF